MRLLSMTDVRKLVLYSRAHIARLEALGQFPRRIRLGNGPRCRVGWIEDEILDWLKIKVAQRSPLTRSD
jgi:prophage regulatory protein